VRNFKVTEKARLLEYLFLILKDSKRTKVKQFLKVGAVLVNGKSITQFDHPLVPGDQVSIKSARDPRPVDEPDYGVEIVYHDNDLVIINKPAGLLSIATEKEGVKTAIFAVGEYLDKLETERLRQIGRRESDFRDKPIYIVHRLDQAASGLMVFAKSEAVKLKLQGEWDQAIKKYYAVVEGVPKNKTGTIESHLHESISLRVYSTPPDEGGKLSISHYEMMRASSHYAILQVKIDTGRKHQIRVHLSDSGHPIVGDDRYGSRTNPIRRLALHGCYLSFKHPVTGKQVTFQSELPRLFDQILNQDKLNR